MGQDAEELLNAPQPTSRWSRLLHRELLYWFGSVDALSFLILVLLFRMVDANAI